MTKRSRTELKNIFSKGKIPGEKDFHDLIESQLNRSDDRIEGNPDGGIVIYQTQGASLIEFFKSPGEENPSWYFRRLSPGKRPGLDVGEYLLEESQLEEKPQSRLFIQDKKGVGIQTDQPGQSLEVNGGVAMESRIGTLAVGQIEADGQWWDILPQKKSDSPQSYFAYEILAHSLSPTNRSYHCICHAICIAAYPRENGWLKRSLGLHNRRGMSINNYYYSRKGHRTQFRWAGTALQPRLEIRSRRKVKNGSIHYRITGLFPEKFH